MAEFHNRRFGTFLDRSPSEMTMLNTISKANKTEKSLQEANNEISLLKKQIEELRSLVEPLKAPQASNTKHNTRKK